MLTRVITGVIGAVLLLCVLLWGSLGVVQSVILVCAAVACLEYERLFFQEITLSRRLRLIGFCTLGIITFRFAIQEAWIFFWFPMLLLCVRSVVRSNEEADYARYVRDASMELFGFVYVMCLLGFLLPIAQTGGPGRIYLILFFTIVFAGDTMAYFVGRKFGKRRLATRLSPKKSIEGALGGTISSVVATFVWAWAVSPRWAEIQFLVRLSLIAVLVSILAQFGDLFESMLKRSQAQKDSGQFLPGHGGLLDRIDGFVLAAPVFYFFLIYVLEPK